MEIIPLIDPDLAIVIGEKVLNSKNLSHGKETAGILGQAKKVNQELLPRHKDGAEILDPIRQEIIQNQKVFQLAFPKKIGAIMANIYSAGCRYDEHVDVAWMGNQHQGWFRGDYSFTLSLSDPAKYKGGQLVLRDGKKRYSVKLKPGEMILYESGLPHKVEEITEGSRVSVVGWIQSFVRDPNLRTNISELDRLAVMLMSRKLREESEIARTILQNLLRMQD